MNFLVTACLGPAAQSVMKLLDGFATCRGVDMLNGGYRADDSRYLDWITEQSEDCDYIWPTSDEEVAVLRRAMPLSNRLIAPCSAAVDLARDKAALYERLRAREGTKGLLAPDYLIGGFMKPRCGRGSRGTDYIEESHVVCEYLPGREYSIDALFWFGRLIAHVIRERSHVKGHIATHGRITDNHSVETRFAGFIAAMPSLHGIINVQMIEDRFGMPKITDFNPRPGGGLTISAQAGVNLPRLLVRLLRSNMPWPRECVPTADMIGKEIASLLPPREEPS